MPAREARLSQDDVTAAGPRGSLSIRTVAMPADTNPRGDIFGGWLLAQMDIAGGIAASARADGRCATIAVETMKFHQPVHVGDVLSVYAEVVRVGRTSLACHIEAWVARLGQGRPMRVTEGTFTYVAIGSDGRPRPVPQEIGTA